MLPNVSLICATAGRHFQLERAVRCFLDQDYTGNILLLIYNNSETPQVLDDIKLPLNRRIQLINNYKDYRTGKKYTNLGAIYRDALTHIPASTEVVSHYDNDDTYLPFHVSEGVGGYQQALFQDKLAYKPLWSYYRDVEGVHRVINTMEPSIFIQYAFLKKHGYHETTCDQHLKWVDALLSEQKLFVDTYGTSSFIYHWNGEEGVFKTSGNPGPDNFANCRTFSNQHGDGIITPLSKEDIQSYYQL